MTNRPEIDEDLALAILDQFSVPRTDFGSTLIKRELAMYLNHDDTVYLPSYYISHGRL